MEKNYEKVLEKIPETVDFSFITVKNETTRILILENPLESSILFKIEVADTYIIEPSKGVLNKHNKAEIKIKIIPESATVLIANALITIDEKITKVIKLSSIAKYPYLTLSKNMLDFGNVIIGKSKEQELIITNPEKVPAKFVIKKRNLSQVKANEPFYLSNYKGEIDPQASFLLKVKYVTNYPNYLSHETFEVKTIGGNKNRFLCSGNSLALTSHISAKNVNFNSMELTGSTTKMIRLYNDSDVPTTYQFFYHNDGPFYIQELQGTIEARSNVRINVSFKPLETIIYYERVFCLVKNHFLYALDLYGSCHDLLHKTKLIDQKHLEIFRFKLGNGFYFNQTSNSISLKDFDISTYLDNVNKSYRKNIIKDKFSSDGLGEDPMLESTNQTQLHKEMFWESNSNLRLCHANVEMIDFRFVEYGKVSEPFNIIVYNNSNEKMKLKWILDKQINTSNLTKNYNLFQSENVIFIVSPEEAVVNRRSWAEFKVYFKPRKSEYYYFSDLTCLATLMTNYEQKHLSDRAFDLISKSQLPNQTLTSLNYKTNLLKNKTSNDLEYFDPPIPIKVSVVGHSFPPNIQIFMPMMEVSPEKEIIFPPSSLLQSGYQTLTIKNNSDTPLYFKFVTDSTNVFRVHPKCGLIPSKKFNLICVEFCPKEIDFYKFPLKIMFNHDTQNMHTVILQGLCVDPLIEVEGINDEIYFPPSYVGINTKKIITLVNRSPIRINVEISIEQSQNGVINVKSNYFDMEANQIEKIEVFLCPLKVCEIEGKIEIKVGRIYDHLNEFVGIFNPGSFRIKPGSDKHDKRIYRKTLKILGKGADGELRLDPPLLQFGTVKVGFYKKMYFSIYNPTICNFYVKLEIPEDQKYYEQFIHFDFSEGLIHSLCKKDVSVTFRPINRQNFQLRVGLYAVDNKNDKMTQSIMTSMLFEVNKSLKSELLIEANGDYPLIKIVDIRNSNIGSTTLWKNFNLDEANEELLKQLTEEEINFINNEKTNKNIQHYYDKLKCIKFNFGRFVKKNSKINSYVDIFITLQNVGGVTSEFFFKLPDDIAIKREIWMDPVEPTSHETKEYLVLKEKIFEIEPKKSKLEPDEYCNIRFRYHLKERDEHQLRVIFQIVNGKPLIFELNAQTHSEKKGLLEIVNPHLDFHYVPMGYMIPIIAPIEIKNIGGIKLKYQVDDTEIQNYNTKNDMKIFQIENTEGSLGPGDIKYIIGCFKPHTNKYYTVSLPVIFTDEVSGISQTTITMSGYGYHPLNFKPPNFKSTYDNMPTYRIYNKYEGDLIQKCGVSLETIDFSDMEDKGSKTFIIYNYSMFDNMTFEFVNPGFTMKDTLEFDPPNFRLEPKSYSLVKIKLTPGKTICSYEGEVEIKIVWNANPDDVPKPHEKESLFIRIIKKSRISHVPETFETTINPNLSFVETILVDYIKEILCDPELDKMLCDRLDNQPPSLYEWTNDISYTTHESVRNKLINNYINKAMTNNEPNNSSVHPNKRNIMSSMNRTSAHHTSFHFKAKKEETSNTDNFDDKHDAKIEEKYLYELIGKFKYTLPSVNEKILLVNEESRNLISSILENTVYNIVSEAVYGETDLSEKTKIYFVKK